MKIQVTQETKKLHTDAIVADLHVDTFLWSLYLGYNIKKRHRSYIPLSPFLNHADVPRIKDGGVNVVGFGVVSNPKWKKPFNQTMRYMHVALRGIERCHGDMELALTATRAGELVAGGKIAAVLGLEGAHCIEGSMDNFEVLYDMGIRYFTLTHFAENEAGYPANDLKNTDKGLKPFGKELVKVLNERKVLIDVAHLGIGCLKDVVKLAKGPIFASHAGIRSAHDHWRNINDDGLKAIADSGGCVGVIFFPWFLKGKISCPLTVVVEHIERAMDVMGEDHVALGSDFDGGITVPTGMKDIADMPKLTQLLKDRGHSDETVTKIIGGNFMRVFKQVCG